MQRLQSHLFSTRQRAAGKTAVCPCGQKLKVLAAAPSIPASIFDEELPLVANPYQSPPTADAKPSSSSKSSKVKTVISGQKFLIFSILGYLCSLPILALANAFLDGTPEKPIVTASFFVVLALGMLGILAAACCACLGIFRMGSVLFPGSTRYIYAIGVLLPVPLIGLLVMFVANSKATGYLKANGVRVGFLGAIS
jgi:hypothetical protein